MPTIKCECGQELHYGPALYGMRVKCPKCSAVFALPNDGSPPPTTPTVQPLVAEPVPDARQTAERAPVSSEVHPSPRKGAEAGVIPRVREEHREAEVAEAEGAGPRPNFWLVLPTTPAYPLRRGGLAMLIGGAVFFAAVKLLQRILIALRQVPLAPYFANAMRSFLLVLFAGYLGAYVLDMVGASAHGEDTPPDWPDSTAPVESVVKPFLYLLAIAALAFGPAAGYCHAYKRSADREVLFLLKALGCLYMPMAILAVAVYRDPRSLNPWYVIKGVILVAPRYFAAWILTIVGLWAISRLPRVLERHVPYATLRDALLAALALYCLFVVARVLGLLYYTSWRTLRWLEQ